MLSSPLVSRSHFALILSLLSIASAQSIAGASLLYGNGAPGAGQYQLVDNYDGASNFFNKFNYYSSYDPTYGHVQYVSQPVAVQNNYTTIAQGKAIISVDTTNHWPNGGPGRPSVRLISDNTYTHGLFILDLNHMPWGCGTWPAYWLLGPDWPSHGEIDIIEGVNTATQDSVSLHTNAGCTVTGSGQTAVFETSNCDEAANGNSGCGSLLNNTATPNNYGQPLNQNGGGVYATEWTSNYFKTWFFGRGMIPTSITNGAPDTSQFGTPAVNHQGGCQIDEHFGNMSIIINTDFCGAWAGQVYQSQFPQCPQNASASSLDSCVDFVGNNPSYFTEAYWSINSIKVYQMPPGVQPSSSYTTSLSSATPSASTNTINQGMGGTTSTISSSAYTGPLSSALSTTSSASSSSATPFICPGSNGTQWTDYNGQQYTIQCGSDYNGGPLSGSQVLQAVSFEACLELCDSLNGCLAAAFLGGNGAGNCYPKASRGMFNYDGHTNAGVRVAGPVSLSSSSSVMASSSSRSSSSVMASSTVSSSSSSIMAMSSTGSSSSSAITTSSSRSSSSSWTSASTVGTSTSTSASSNPTSGLQCPSSNGSTYADSSGTKYTMLCDTDTNPGAFGTSTEPDFQSCINACTLQSSPSCVAVTFVSGVCYYKSQFQGTSSSVGVEAAVKISLLGTSSASSAVTTSSMMASIYSGLTSTGSTVGISSIQSTTTSSTSPTSTISCPSVSGSQLTDSNRQTYTIQCGSDTSGGTFATQTFANGDFAQCMTACDSTGGCGAWTWSPYSTGGICYLKLGPASFTPGSESLVAGIMAMRFSSTSTRAAVSSLAQSTANSQASSTIATSGRAGTTTTSSGVVGSITASAQLSVSQGTSSVSSASVGVLPACSSSACNSVLVARAAVSPCQDSSGNAYNLKCGLQYSGSVERQVDASDINACLVQCDMTEGCVAVNFVNGTCSLLSNVISMNTIANSGAAAATRPAGVYVVVSTPVATWMGPTNSMTAIATSASYTSSSSGQGVVTGYPTEPWTSIASSAVGTFTTYSGAGPAAPCPSSTAGLCSSLDTSTTCSSTSGNTYSVECGIENEGTVIDTSETSMKNKRASLPTFQDCQSLCDHTAGCVALNYEGQNCTLLSSVLSTSNVPGAVGATIVSYSSSSSTLVPPPTSITASGVSGRVTVTPTKTLGTTSILSLPSGATITVIPLSTVTSFVGQGGSISASRSLSRSAGGGGKGSGGGDACLCHSCALTPTVVPGSSCKSTSAPTGGGGGNNAGKGTCKPHAGIGTTTFFSTHTITNCNKLPGVCPSSGYVIGGGGTKTQSGATVVTTTDKNGHTFTYTQIPTGPGKGSKGTGTAVKSTATTTTTAQPTCPFSDSVLFTSSMGMIYDIECNEYFTDETLDVQTQNSLGGCIAACDMYNTMSFMKASPCLGVSWFSMQETKNCELKSGSHAVYQQGVHSARLTTPYTGPGSGGNGTGSGGGSGPGSGGMTITGSITALPIVTTFVTGGSTVITSIVKGGSTILSTYVTRGSTVVTSVVTGGSTVVSTYVTGGSTLVQTVTGGRGYGQGGTGSGTGGGGTGLGGSGGNGPGTGAGTGPGTGAGGGPGTGPGTGIGTGPGTGPGTGAGTGPGTGLGTGPGTGPGTGISYVPSTIHSVSTAVSTFVSNGITQVSTYGVTTAVSVVLQPTTKTVTTTTVSVSLSVSISNQVSTVTGPTFTQSAHLITITEGGGGAGGYITVTAPPSVIVSYIYPSSSSSSFTCRTYATNYLNGQHGKVKRTNKRSVFDIDSPLVLGEGEMMRPQPGAVPIP